MYQTIKNKAFEVRNELIDFTRELITIPSTSGNEGSIIQRIKQEMKAIGYQSIQVDEMGNLIGRIGSGRKKLVIEGHADTVEVGNPDNWAFDPFKGKLENGIIYGRGAGDQKGGVAAAVYTGKILRELFIPKELTFLVVISVQEEVYEGLNWRYIIQEDKIYPDMVILTEPSGLKIVNNQRGRVDLKVKTTGISSHGATPDLGDNAIYKMIPIISDIQRMNRELPLDPPFGKACISVTDIRSTSPSINAIADSATIHIDRRLTKEDTEESVIKDLASLNSVKEANAAIYIPEIAYESPSGQKYPIKAFYPSWYTEETSPIVQTALTAYKQQFGQTAQFSHWSFSTNGAAIKGIFDIPTIGFGPGYEKFAHTTDDQVPVEHLIKSLEFYSSFIMTLDGDLSK
ncbi:MAG: YgeY family selenium metabolism-linked hydrolase [Candidatus Hodarchaeales archaeon]|jgi:putative selenium metabolism hydrolase